MKWAELQIVAKAFEEIGCQIPGVILCEVPTNGDFARLPVVYQGRAKPFDTLARNTLRVISNKETVDDYTKYDC